MILLNFILLLGGLIIVSPSYASQQCTVAVDSLFSAQTAQIRQLEADCYQGGGHSELSSDKIDTSCKTLGTIMNRVQTSYSECETAIEIKNNCESDGGIWTSRGFGGGAPWEGSCDLPTCPTGSHSTAGTSDELAGECACNNDSSIYIPSSGNGGECESEENEITDCGAEKLQGIDPPAEVEAFMDCKNKNAIAQQIIDNTEAVAAEVQRQMTEVLPDRLSALESAERARVEQACNDLQSAYDANPQCNPDTLNTETSESGAEKNSLAACTAASKNFADAIEANKASQSTCESLAADVIRGCALSIAPQRVSSGTISRGQGEATITDRAVLTSDPSTLSVPANAATVSSTSGLNQRVKQAISQANSNLEGIMAAFDQCIADFKPRDEGPDDPDGPSGPGNTADGNNNTTIITNTESTTDGSNETAQSGEVESSPSILDGIGQLAQSFAGSSSSDETFKTSINDTAGIQSGFEGINSSYTGGSSYGNNTRRGESQLNLGNGAPGGDHTQGLADDPRAPNNPVPVQANNINGVPGGQGNIGQAGRAGAARLSSSDGSAGKRRNRGRGRSAVKSRNLLNGYKNVRATDGGGSLSIKPSDMKRYGRRTMKAKLNAARKKFGVKVPLMFKNGKFVRDFLAMKEGKGFKSRQAAMEGYWRGNNRKSGIGDHECVGLNECHTNVKANIFKLMNFRLQKSFHKVKIDI